MPRFLHISDLHLGKSAAVDRDAELLAAMLQREPGAILLTGDVTHRGQASELRRFRELFAPLEDRMVVVPGNHDRLGDDLRDALMPGARVQSAGAGGLFVVRVDTTGPHNRRWLDGHGLLTDDDIEAAVERLREAPCGAETVVLLHHHPLPLPCEDAFELVTAALGLPNGRELPAGARLLARLRGLCDVVLHGHRHVPAESSPWPADARPLRVFSAGSSTLQRRFRIFSGARSTGCWVPLASAEPAGVLYPASDFD